MSNNLVHHVSVCVSEASDSSTKANTSREVEKITRKKHNKTVTELDMEAAQPSRPLKLAFMLPCVKLTKRTREDSHHSINGRPLEPNMETTM